MGGVTPASLAPILLVLGDEELLATRAVTEAVAKVRSVDPEVDVREYQAGALTVGEIAEMLSPSLFGGRRLLILRSGQDAR
ncbi:DNA polymerase III subunit delta, partial [Micromonospora sp. NPDC002411]